MEGGLEPGSNHLLGMLAEPVRSALLPALRRVHLPRGTLLQEARVPVHQVHFPISCVVSLLRAMPEGVSVEAACVGPEGMVGAAALVPSGLGEARALVQVAGEAWAIEAAELQRLAQAHPSMGHLFQRFQSLLLLQVMQTLGCNQFHTAEQRMARWLLTMFDRAGADELALTHEFLADVLALRRPTVTSLARRFRSEGALEFSRGRMRLRDPAVLGAMACECHGRLEADIARFRADAPKAPAAPG